MNNSKMVVTRNSFENIISFDIFAGVESFNWPLLIISFLSILLAYVSFVKTLNINRDLLDVGFEYLKDGSHCTVENQKLSKRVLLKAALRRRAVGDLPPIYPNGWFALLESCHLGIQEVKYVAALGENFAVFRSGSGEAHILNAYCPHLGANMAVGGSVHGDCLECPFHKWQFSGKTGSCTSVPYSSSNAPAVKVKRWKCMEVNDMIFVWYHAEGEDPSWFIEPHASLSNGKWWFHGRSDFIVGCHIQEIPENGADVGHLDALHGASLLGGADVRHCERQPYQFMRHLWWAQWEQSATDPHKGIIKLSQETRLFGKYAISRLEAHIQQIGPGYVELLLQAAWGPMLIVQTVTPLEALQQRVIHRIYSPFLTGPLSRFTLFVETIMFQRDVMIWSQKKYESKPHLVREDSGILRHRRWYNQFYTEHSPRFQHQKKSLDW